MAGLEGTLMRGLMEISMFERTVQMREGASVRLTGDERRSGISSLAFRIYTWILFDSNGNWKVYRITKNDMIPVCGHRCAGY